MGHYRVVRKLAAGGMAEVLLAKVIGAGGFEKPVAVKRMLPSVAADPSFVEAFLREARLTVILQHPNIVQVHDFGAVKGHYYQVLEYVDGENLRQLLNALLAQGQTLSVAEACFLVQQVAEGLAYAHGVSGQDRKPLNIIHRDINPSNVMVSRIGEVKLADFGIAKATDGTQGTQVGVIKGKAGYLSPEQVRGTDVDQRSDLFLMGLLLHELLSAKRLFDAPNYFQALQRIAAFDPRQLQPLPNVPPTLWAILVKLLEPEPAQRMPSARALSEDLQAFLFDARLRVSTKEIAALFARAFPARTSPLEALAGAAPGEEIQIDDSQVIEARTAARPPSAQVQQPRTPAPSAPPSRATPAHSARALDPAAVQEAVAGARPPSGGGARVGGRKKLSDILIAQGKVTPAQIEDAKRLREGRMGERLTAMGLVSALDVVRALAEQNGIPYVSDEKLRAAPVPEEAIKLLKQEVAARYDAVPLQLRGKTLLCAMLDPLDIDAVKALKFAAGVGDLKPVFATEGAIRAARERFYRGDAPDSDDWRGRVPGFESATIKPFADRVTGTREHHFDEAELERRMALAVAEDAVVDSTPSTPPAGVGEAGKVIPIRGTPTKTEPTNSVRLAASAALGGIRKILLVSDRPEQLEHAAALLAGSGVSVVAAAPNAAEVQLLAESPDAVVVAEDGVAQAHALARALAAKAPGVDVRTATLAAGVAGEGPVMGRVAALYAAALDALWAAGEPLAPESVAQIPAAARLCRQLAGWLGGGKVEQERAAALLHAVAAANRVAGADLFAAPDAAALSTISNGESTDFAELLALWSPRPPPRARPAAQAVVAALAFIDRAGAVQVERDDATFAIDRILAESALPEQQVEALRAVVYQGGEAGQGSVVVVDADATAAGILQQRLVGAGLRAVLARSGAEARELLRKGAGALIASTALPDTEGAALVAAIRGEHAASRPIIYLLAHDASEDVSAGLDAGADDVMVKPVSAEVIAAKLKRALGARGGVKTA